MQLSCCGHCSFLVVIITSGAFSPSSAMIPELWEEQVEFICPLRADHSVESCSLCFGQLRVSEASLIGVEGMP